MVTLLGIDIGGTKIAGGVVDAETGAVLLRGRVPTNAVEGGASVLARSIALAHGLIADARAQGIAAPAGVGVGSGGQINPRTGAVAYASELLPGWTGTPLQQAFADALGIPARADNDVNALAVGEMRFGAGRGSSDVLFVALGTGVGGAIVANGELVRGARGGGGEIGHLILYPDAPASDAFGAARGAWENYACGAALPRRYQERGGVSARTGPEIAALAASGDTAAAAAVADVGNAVGLGLASLVAVLNPEKIIVGGGLAELGDLLLAPARASLAARAVACARDTPVVPAALGADAAVVGAACLAL